MFAFISYEVFYIFIDFFQQDAVECGEKEGLLLNKREYCGKLAQLGILNKIPCGDEESKRFEELKTEDLPEDVFSIRPADASGKTLFFRYSDVPDPEINNKLLLINADNIKTIKNCVIFFTVIAVIGLVLAVVIPLIG